MISTVVFYFFQKKLWPNQIQNKKYHAVSVGAEATTGVSQANTPTFCWSGSDNRRLPSKYADFLLERKRQPAYLRHIAPYHVFLRSCGWKGRVLPKEERGSILRYVTEKRRPARPEISRAAKQKLAERRSPGTTTLFRLKISYKCLSIKALFPSFATIRRAFSTPSKRLLLAFLWLQTAKNGTSFLQCL